VHWVTLEIAGLHGLNSLNAGIAALNPAFATAHADRMSARTLNLDGPISMPAPTVSEGKRLALYARGGKATAPALDRTHLEAAAALNVGLGTAATAVLDAERVSTSAAGLVMAAAAPGLGSTVTTTAVTVFAWLGARRHRDRQSGDTSGKKQPGHYKSPSYCRSNGPRRSTFHR